MAQRLSVLRSDSDSCSVSISPVIKLARCVTTEDTLEQLAEIVIGKGVTPLGIRLSRPGINREWKPREAFPINEESYEINAQVEGEQTRIDLRLAGSVSPDVCCEIESAAYMAAHRIELCERKLWSGKGGSTSDSIIELEGLIGSSEPMQALRRLIKSAAGCDSMTLIAGESGTGKELAARGIHNLSSRASRPFVAINCGAFAESLLESELFGYVKGAFTGAVANRNGLFEAANGGTIFLDEIGEMPLAMQVKLLRVLQEKK